MYHLWVNICVLLFGLIAVGAALASAGKVVGIPMMLLGTYLTYKGWRIYKHEERKKLWPHLAPDKPHLSKVGIGLLLILIIGICLIYEVP